MIKRGKFVPARDAAGRPAYGVVYKTVPWFPAMTEITSIPAEPIEIDAELTVNIPSVFLSSRPEVCNAAISDRGWLVDCSASGDSMVPTKLAKRACKFMIDTFGRFEPARDAAEEPVASVQELNVTFRAEFPVPEH